MLNKWHRFLLLFDFVLSLLIIYKVPCKYFSYSSDTEIDWSTYMQQVSQFIGGERDYSKIQGDSGPIAYPAGGNLIFIIGFLYVFSGFYYLTMGGNIFIGQLLYVLVLLATNFVVFRITEKLNLPQGYSFLIIISKRIHSIYLLRLFNDPIAILFEYFSISLLLSRHYFYSTVFFALALSVKMNILLFLPGFALILFCNTGIIRTFLYLSSVIVIEMVLGMPFSNYFDIAFNFKRQFLYKWTVNYRFLPEEIFNNSAFHTFLLLGHVLGLLYFLHYKWLPKGIFAFIRNPFAVQKRYNQTEIMKIMVSCNLLGVSFARSLHYQFYSWYFHTIPFILSLAFPQTVKGGILSFTIYLLLEYCWNVFPSTSFSSILLNAVHFLLIFRLIKSR